MKKLLLLCATLLLPCLVWAKGIAFTEEMHGYAYYQGEYRNVSVYFEVAIKDIDAWRANPNYPAQVSGRMRIERLPDAGVAGTLQILPPAPNDAGRLLTYRFSGGGIQFVGIKHVYNNAGLDMMDDMTTLHGLFQPQGAQQPTVQDLLYGHNWTSELHFEWWKPATLWNFSWSFETIDTPWYQDLSVKILFLKTIFGNLATVLFPWAV